ncbi:Protein of unknown function DUF3680 [Moorella glycerini]|uniref:Uncharacterized protein n=1 Tax=Neomoorella stamsii TaxID=1266720 RepID=A0A9X7P5Z5_9FIRM|nr:MULTISPECIES: CopG family antitoxin [Moorella]PRR72414.1 hypothetical protein MOST_21250 [Moorella stamsii]CEP67423.1 Protein of unknown function DUF3680 [Moorella glycerini]
MIRENKIPDFTTIKEARDFLEKNSLADFAESLEEAKEVRFTGRNNLVVTLNLEKEDLKRLRLLARKKGVKYADLITAWVKEHLRES